MTLPNGKAYSFNLTDDVNAGTTSGLLKLNKGLFIKLYCVANCSKLYKTDGDAVTLFDNFKSLEQRFLERIGTILFFRSEDIYIQRIDIILYSCRNLFTGFCTGSFQDQVIFQCQKHFPACRIIRPSLIGNRCYRIQGQYDCLHRKYIDLAESYGIAYRNC
mgnify:CR=1 FL=1